MMTIFLQGALVAGLVIKVYCNWKASARQNGAKKWHAKECESVVSAAVVLSILVPAI